MDLFDLCVRLKVCEGCGCLWYRSEIELTVYCHLCLDRLKEFPTVKSRKLRGRPRKISLPTVFAVEDLTDHSFDYAASSFERTRPLPYQSGIEWTGALAPEAALAHAGGAQ